MKDMIDSFILLKVICAQIRLNANACIKFGYINLSNMKKKILIFTSICVVAIASLVNINFNNYSLISDTSLGNISIMAEAQAEGGTCRWATRETSQGWQAICISSGVGYYCNCGDVKNYY